MFGIVPHFLKGGRVIIVALRPFDKLRTGSCSGRTGWVEMRGNVCLRVLTRRKYCNVGEKKKSGRVPVLNSDAEVDEQVAGAYGLSASDGKRDGVLLRGYLGLFPAHRIVNAGEEVSLPDFRAAPDARVVIAC